MQCSGSNGIWNLLMVHRLNKGFEFSKALCHNSNQCSYEKNLGLVLCLIMWSPNQIKPNQYKNTAVVIRILLQSDQSGWKNRARTLNWIQIQKKIYLSCVKNDKETLWVKKRKGLILALGREGKIREGNHSPLTGRIVNSFKCHSTNADDIMRPRKRGVNGSWD